MKKKIIKLPNGMAAGSETFGTMCKPKGGRSASRTHELISRASQRIADLMTTDFNKDQSYYINKKQLEDLNFRNELAESPKLVQFAYWKGHLKELREELNKLRETNNDRKIELIEPTIKIQIKEVEEKMRELFKEIQNEKTIVK